MEGIANGVEDLVAGLAVDDELLGAEDGEVLGDVGLLHTELFNEGAGGEFSRTSRSSRMAMRVGWARA